MKQLLILIPALLLFSNTLISQVSSKLEPESILNLIISEGLSSKYNAIFTRYSGEIKSLNKEDYKHAIITLSAESNSIKSQKGNEVELMSADFLNSSNFPAISLIADSAKLYRSDLNEFELDGVITIRNVSKKIKLKAYLLEGPSINKDAKFIKIKLYGGIKGSDFGMKEDKTFHDSKTGEVIGGGGAAIDFLLVFKIN